MQYELLGTDVALQLFSVNPDNGALTVRQPLLSTPLAAFTLVVRAYDSGQPAKDDITTFTLTMNQNKFPPIINPLTYSVTINETHDIGTVQYM